MHGNPQRYATKCVYAPINGRENTALPGVHKMSAGLAKHAAHARCLTLTWVGTRCVANYPPCTGSGLFAACVLLGDEVRQNAGLCLRVNPELFGSLVRWLVTQAQRAAESLLDSLKLQE